MINLANKFEVDCFGFNVNMKKLQRKKNFNRFSVFKKNIEAIGLKIIFVLVGSIYT
jgi:hypothetical protein